MRHYALNKDILGGVLVLATGLAAIAMGQTYEVGTLARMGPGFFPVAIGALMTVTGTAIALGGARTAGPGLHQVAAPDLRAWLLIPLSLIAFVVVGERAGLLPAAFSTVLVAAFADRQNTWRGTLALAAIMTVVCVLVFWWGLQVQFPLFTWGGDQ